ncbi:MAG: sigma-54-dependent transcriptional regulator [Rhodoferax sp.]
MAEQTPQAPICVLVVDDEPDLRTLYEITLLREGFQVESAAGVAEAWQTLTTRKFDVVITDMRMSDGLGLDLLKRLRDAGRPERCVVITAYGSAENAVESLKAGAFDYLTKPVDLKQFRTVVASAINDARLVRTDSAPGGMGRQKREAGGGTDKAPNGGLESLARLVGESPAMRLVKDRIVKVAKSMAPILVRGESGTGKELAARAIHAISHRSNGPWIAVNCSAIPENLLESEFFGSRKGAFTGASVDRDGYFQAAEGGTLFLDEIGDLPLAMQSKLLRAIQERCVRPVGAAHEEAVNVRIVSATHKDLAAEVRASQFRQDLYFRINVIEIVMPPLRERPGDLELLCNSLLGRIAAETGVPAPAVPPSMLESLACEPLWGNVRELENLLHRSVALSDGGDLQLDVGVDQTLPGTLMDESLASPEFAATGSVSQQRPAFVGDLQVHLDQYERDILVQALKDTGYNRTAAAACLGISLRQIRYRIARLNIDMPTQADSGDDPK